MYIATIYKRSSQYSRAFYTMSEAQQWLDSENRNYEYQTTIETIDKTGRKTDGFFYTAKE